MTGPDPVVAGIAEAVTGATPEQIVAGLRLAGRTGAELKQVVADVSPWVDGDRPRRWRRHDAAGISGTLLAGNPSSRVVELVPDPGVAGQARLFVYEPNPDQSMWGSVGSPLDRMTCVRTEVVAAPPDEAAAYATMEDALTRTTPARE